MLSNIITSSRAKTYNTCRRLHYYKYALGYRPVKTSSALSFGTLVHAGLEAWWGWHKLPIEMSALDRALSEIDLKALESENIDQFEIAKAKTLLCGYDTRWSPTMEDLDVLGVEMEFQTTLLHPDQGTVLALDLAGKIDSLARRKSTGKIWLVEHKTTSEDLSLGAPYWQRLRMDTQVSIYFDGALSLGYPIEGCIYDVVAKFKERPLLATPADKRKVTKEGKLYAGQRAQDETVEEFRARLAESMAKSPESFFGRAEVTRTEDELREAERDTYEIAMSMIDDEREGRRPRNPDACFKYNRLCDFYTVCSGCGAIDDDNFVQLATPHQELKTIP